MKIKLTEIESTKEKLLLYHKPEFLILEEKELNNEINKIIHKFENKYNVEVEEKEYGRFETAIYFKNTDRFLIMSVITKNGRNLGIKL